MPESPGFSDVKSTSAREWDDPKVVPFNEVAGYMEQGWEPCGACELSATNQVTGQPTRILAYCIRRRYSPVRSAIEGTSKLQRARIMPPLPRLPSNGR